VAFLRVLYASIGVKIKIKAYFTVEQATKSPRGRRGIALLFL
jgi:hypothetical protein